MDGHLFGVTGLILIQKESNLSYALEDLNESKTVLYTEDHEFKRLIIDSLSVFTEGYKFMPSFRAGIWDGKKHFSTITENGDIMFPKGLISYVLKKLKEQKKEYTYKKITYEHITEPTKQEFDKWIDTLGLPFTPYDYQSQSAYDAIRHKRLVIQAATGAGKSLILSFIMQWQYKEKRKTLLIVPNVLLLQQMKQDLIDYFGECNFNDRIVTIGGNSVMTKEEKEATFADDSVIISTWQSLYSNSDLVKDVECIIVDEAHGAKGDSIATLATAAESCSWRIGLTGTMPRAYADKMSILAILGQGKVYITPQGLVERGLATPVHITTMFFNYSEEDRKIVKSLKKYPDEIKFLNQHDIRNEKVAKITTKMAQIGNTLLLFDVVAHGKKMLEMLVKQKTHHNKVRLIDKFTPKFVKETFEPDALMVFNGEITEKEIKKYKKILSELEDYEVQPTYNPDMLKSLSDFDVYFIYGGVEASQREEIRQLVKDRKNVTIVGNYQTVSTGLNIPNLMNIILGASTKSFIRLGQTIGRGMRLHHSKNNMNLIDICDDLTYKTSRSEKKNYVMKHFQARLVEYLEWGYPIVEKEINVF